MAAIIDWLHMWKSSVYELYEVAVPRKFKFHRSSIVSHVIAISD